MAHSYITAVFLQQDGLRRLHALAYAHAYSESWIAPQGALLLKVGDAITSESKSELNLQMAATIASEIVSHDQPGFHMLKVTVRWPSAQGHIESAELYTGVACAHFFE